MTGTVAAPPLAFGIGPDGTYTRFGQVAAFVLGLLTTFVFLPLVVVGSRTGIGNRLNEENLALGAFSYNYWNIANWNLAEGAEPV